MAILKAKPGWMPILSLMALALTVSACQPGKRSRSGGDGQSFRAGKVILPPQNPSIQLPQETIPFSQAQTSQIPVRCAESFCPPQVGLILFYLNETDGHGNQLTKRCTGTLANAADNVVSAGHCDKTTEGQGYFITQNGQSYKIVRVLAKEFTRVYDKNGQPTDMASGRPDVALFKLEKPVENIPPLPLASGPQTLFTRLTAYVVNAHPKDPGYIVQAVTCTVKRHEYFWPFSLQEKPDMITGFDCQTKQGNSGAALFAPGDEAIQAIYLGFGNSELNAQLAHPLPSAFDSKWRMMSTNVRCVDFHQSAPVRDCLRADEAVRGERFDQMYQSAMNSLNRRHMKSTRYATAFDAKIYPLAKRKYDLEPVIEVLHYPSCRKRPGALSEVMIPQEKIKLSYDEWGQPRWEAQEQADSFAKVESNRGDIFTLNAYWQPAFGEYGYADNGSSYDDEHPRNKFGNRFAIKLPVCSK